MEKFECCNVLNAGTWGEGIRNVWEPARGFTIGDRERLFERATLRPDALLDPETEPVFNVRPRPILCGDSLPL